MYHENPAIAGGGVQPVPRYREMKGTKDWDEGYQHMSSKEGKTHNQTNLAKGRLEKQNSPTLLVVAS